MAGGEVESAAAVLVHVWFTFVWWSRIMRISLPVRVISREAPGALASIAGRAVIYFSARAIQNAEFSSRIDRALDRAV
jgi:hypothetical protein